MQEIAYSIDGVTIFRFASKSLPSLALASSSFNLLSIPLMEFGDSMCE